MVENKPTVFVIMPFAKEFDPGYRDIIQPAIAMSGMECVRADQEPQGHIHKQMFERIFDSMIVIADISGANPNVFYELGISHCVGSKTITVAREDFVERVPFDIAPYRVLVYPKLPIEPCNKQDRAIYQVRAEEAVKKLASELAGILEDGKAELPNPIQDYLLSRSPLTCVESRYLDRFGGDLEEQLLRHTKEELVHVGLTGWHFTNILAGYIESGDRKTRMKVKLLLLDPEDREGWRFVYHLREGRPVIESELERCITEDRVTQERTERVLKRLNRVPIFSSQVLYYSGIP